MNLELRQLCYFIPVAEEKHFGRAAPGLHMTQPPLSQAIQGLEQVLGTALFARTKRSVALTPAGEALLPEAQRILQQAAALPELALSFISTADYSIISPLLLRFRERFPQVHIELREATTDIQFDELMLNKIDAGLLVPPLPDKIKPQLEYLALLSEPLLAAILSGWRPNGQVVKYARQSRRCDIPQGIRRTATDHLPAPHFAGLPRHHHHLFPRRRRHPAYRPGSDSEPDHYRAGFGWHGNGTCATIPIKSETARRRIPRR